MPNHWGWAFFQKKITRTYHIDYIFGSQKFIDKIIKFEVGEFEEWLNVSDHMPIICKLKY